MSVESTSKGAVEQPFFTAPAVSVDAMFAAARMLSREWGEYGYVIGLHAADYRGGGVFGCRHSDGSEFFLHADRWGNAKQVRWNGEEWEDV